MGGAVHFQLDAALTGFDHAHDTLHERTFAIAIGAQQGNCLAIFNAERHAMQSAHSAIACIDIFNDEFSRQGRPFVLLGFAQWFRACLRK